MDFRTGFTFNRRTIDCYAKFKSINIYIKGRLWTSTERDRFNAYSIIYNETSKVYEVSTGHKELNLGVMPFRRY